MKLDQWHADRAKPTDKYYILWSDEYKGLGLRVLPSGTKTWVLQYRPFPGGRATPLKRLTICRHGPGAAEKARAFAAEKLQAIQDKRATAHAARLAKSPD
jgi:hypothetical protein